jgi:hypothetical protein
MTPDPVRHQAARFKILDYILFRDVAARANRLDYIAEASHTCGISSSPTFQQFKIWPDLLDICIRLQCRFPLQSIGRGPIFYWVPFL